MTPHQWQLQEVTTVDPSLAATLLSPLMSLLFFILIFALLISGDSFVAANDPSSVATT
jgi:hypothetical protein